MSESARTLNKHQQAMRASGTNSRKDLGENSHEASERTKTASVKSRLTASIFASLLEALFPTRKKPSGEKQPEAEK